MLNWWFREPSIFNIEATTQDEEKQEIEEEIKEEVPEYIWVDGYKGTSKDMQGYNNFQYELGKEYTCKDIIISNMSLEKNILVKEPLKFARMGFISL